jgi:hypothetical protein
VSDIKRYEFETYTDEVSVKPEGDWVLYADHKDQLAALTAERDELQKAIHGEYEWNLLKQPDCAVAMPTVEDSCREIADLQHRAAAAEAKVRELELENERIKHEAIRMAAHAPPTFEAEYVKLQAKLAAVRELVDKANIELSNTDALLMIYQTVKES